MSKPSTAIDAIISHLTFLLPTLITFVVYVSTTSNSVAGGDAGELVAEGCRLGTAHPPGYPLYTLIVGAVVRLKKFPWFDGAWFGNDEAKPVYWVNVTSCVCGSIALGLISLIVFRLTKDLDNNNPKDDEASNTNPKCRVLSSLARAVCAVSTSLMCSFSPLMWQYNKEAEVFALHNLFVSAILYVLTVYAEAVAAANVVGTTKANNEANHLTTIVIGAFLCGLSLTNQHTSILLIVPVAAFVFYQSSIFQKPKLLLISALSFVVGLSPYIALPILATLHPHAGSWGDVTSFSGFIHHLLRQDYGTLRLFSGDDTASEGMVARSGRWAYDFSFSQLCHPMVVCFLVLGVASQLVHNLRRHSMGSSAKKKAKRARQMNRRQQNCKPTNGAGRVIAFALFFYLAVFHSLSNLPLSNPLLFGIHQRFWMHSNILAFVLLGCGMYKSMKFTSGISQVLPLMLSATTLLLPLIQYRKNHIFSDQSSNTLFRSYALSILETLPPNALLLINYDQQWTSVRYLQECEGVREDVRSINLSMMTYPWWKTKHRLYPGVEFPGTHYTKDNTMAWANGGFTFSELIDANIEYFEGNIFVGGTINYVDRLFEERYEEIPHGLVRKIAPRTIQSTYPVEHYRKYSLETWSIVSQHLSSNLPCSKKYPSSTWEWTIAREFFEHMVSRSTYLLDLALKNNEENQLVLPSIVEAAAWLELASSWDSEGNYDASPSMKKNLGLAYMNIVRNKEQGGFPFVEDVFGVSDMHRRNWWSGELTSGGETGDSWKGWATIRWTEEWGAFLNLDASKSEPGYHQVKSIYETVMTSSRYKSSARG